jgi:hypothetical protein
MQRIKQENLNFVVKLLYDQFYTIKYNSQCNYWIELKFYKESPNILFYFGLRFQINQK